jgi:hypothetical protein
MKRYVQELQIVYVHSSLKKVSHFTLFCFLFLLFRVFFPTFHLLGLILQFFCKLLGKHDKAQ